MRFRIAAFGALASAFASGALAADAALIAAAQKEGEVVWLGSLAMDDLARPLIDAFETKYKVRIRYARIAVSDIVLKVSAEAAAGAHNTDFVDGTFASQALKAKGLVEPWLPSSVERFPKNFVDPDKTWVAINYYVATPAFNTELIAKGSEPRTLNDLLDPKWKGKIAWSSVAGIASGAGFIGTILRDMGESAGMDYLRRLAAQEPIGVPYQARAVLDHVISGEYALQLQNFNSQVVVQKAKGAPIDWIPMNPGAGVLILASVVRQAPHPNAAKLLLDFLVSEEGQKIFYDRDYIPADPAIAPRDPSVAPDGQKFRALFIPPDEVERDMPKWLDIYQGLFR